MQRIPGFYFAEGCGAWDAVSSFSSLASGCVVFYAVLGAMGSCSIAAEGRVVLDAVSFFLIARL